MKWTLLPVFLFSATACSPPAQNPPLPLHAHESLPTALLRDDGPHAPIAKRDPRTTFLHGKTLVDDYFWLRNKGASDVVAYLESENAYTSAMTKSFEPLERALYDEMLARIKEDDSTPPANDGAWRYYKRYEKRKAYPIHCRIPAANPKGHEAIVLDLNDIGKTEKFVGVEEMAVTDDGNTLAYLLDTTGFRQFILKVKDLRSGQHGPEAIPRVDFVAFAKDNKTAFYVTQDAQTKRPNKLFRHTLGQDPTGDTLVYEEKDEMYEIELARTRSKAFLVLTSASRTTSEVRVIDAAKPTSAPRLIAPREHDHEYYVDHREGFFYIRTNSNGRNFRLVTAPVTNPGRDAWKEIVPHRKGVMLEDVFLFQDHMISLERQDALPRFTVLDFKSGTSQRLEEPEQVYDVHPDDNREFSTRTFRYKYQSFATPSSIVDLDVATRTTNVLQRTEVLGGFDANAYETRRILAPARDGTKIPVSLVFKKGTEPNGKSPLYLYAYGSYGYTIPLSFSHERISLLNRGFVYAHAHIRGGSDMGKTWHDQGRMTTKMNTFTDFIDVAEHLKTEGWAKKGGLVVAGGSAGGLLMGATLNMRSDLFDVVLAYVPFVDVISTMLDETLPLTVSEFEEWGNPKKKEEFDYLLRYSPYDNVQRRAYPTMLVRTSYNDSQVMYWEPAKWVAKLRAMKTDPHPLLFKINMQPAGHGGQSGRYDRLRDTAFDYAFILTQLGVQKQTFRE